MLCYQIRVKGGKKFVCEGKLITSYKDIKSGDGRAEMICEKCKTLYTLIRPQKAKLLLDLAKEQVNRS